MHSLSCSHTRHSLVTDSCLPRSSLRSCLVQIGATDPKNRHKPEQAIAAHSWLRRRTFLPCTAPFGAHFQQHSVGGREGRLDNLSKEAGAGFWVLGLGFCFFWVFGFLVHESRVRATTERETNLRLTYGYITQELVWNVHGCSTGRTLSQLLSSPAPSHLPPHPLLLHNHHQRTPHTTPR